MIFQPQEGVVRDMSEDISKVEKWSKAATVGPESIKTGETDFHAFSISPEEELFLDFVPTSVMNMLKDKSSWNNRLTAVNDIDRILKTSCGLSDADLKSIVDLILVAVNDSQSKVSQKGLQVLEYLVTMVGKGIIPYLTSLTPKVLTKIGSNKGNLKKAGMGLFKTLMNEVGPMQVLNEVANNGLRYKTSRVREESVNVIISGLVHYENGGLQLLPIAMELIPCMADSKAKVRQASFEALALITSRLEESELSQVISAVISIDKASKPKNENGLNLMDAYQSRLARRSVPKLDEHGLVQYSIPVLKTSSETLYTGPDVDWIAAAIGGGSTHTQAESSSPPQLPPTSATSGPPSTFRPYRSAGNRPWETDGKQEVGTVSAPAQLSSSNLPSTAAVTPVIASSSTATTISTNSKKLPGNSYVELHLSKLRHPGTNNVPSGGVARSSSQPIVASGMIGPKSQPQIQQRNSLNNIPVKAEKPGSVRRTPFEGVYPASVPMVPRHHPLPEEMDAHQSLAVVVSGPSNEKVLGNSTDMHPMSLTWPRANLALNTGSAGPTTVPPLKGPVQINADPLGMAGVQNAVKTSFSRPPSKPRVRNPLTLLKSQTQSHGISPPLSGSGCPIPNIGSNRGSTDSPTQLERDFLASGGNPEPTGPPGWGEASFDDEYFMIPEDMALLDSSLTSSLSSLCAGKDGEGPLATPDVDKLKHIRREAASRKAQIISANTTASNSPETSRHPSSAADQTATAEPPNTRSFSPPNWALKQVQKVPPSQQPAHVDMKATPVVKKSSADRVYGAGREEKTYSQAFTKKLLSTPNKLPYKVIMQTKREKEKGAAPSQTSEAQEPDPSVASFSISLEGHGLDRGEGGAPPSRDAQQKKRTKRPGVHPVQGKNRTTISSSLFASQEGSARPTIERGGTNTISMEVSGVGSRGSTSENKTSLLSQTTKESFIRKKQRYQSEEEEATNTQSSPLSYSKKPSLYLDSSDTSLSSTNSTSAPVEGVHRRNRQRRGNEGSRTVRSHSEFGSGPSSRDAPRGRSQVQQTNKTTLTVADADSSFSSGGGNSPQEMDFALVESQVHSNPDQAVRIAQQSIASEDWSNKCQGIVMIICIARQYPNLLQPHLHPVLLAVQKEVKNLRSSVAKKAVECLTFLFSTMKRAMEPDLDHIVQSLLHKCSESNAFLREVVDKSIAEMIANVNPSKALIALIMGGLSYRNSQVRKMTSKYICEVIENFDPSKFLHSSKDLLEKALPAIIQLIKDGSPDARYYARRSLNVLWPEPDFFQVAGRVLTNNLLAEAKEAVETLKMKGVGDPNGSSSTSGSRHPTGSLRVSMQSSPHKDPQYELSPHYDSSRQSSSSSSTGPPSRRSRKQYHHHTSNEPLSVRSETSLPEGLVERMQANSWSERYETITELEKYVVAAAPQTMSPQLQKVFDVFCLRLTDRNSKVNLHALQAFSTMVPVMHSALVPIINNIMGTLVPNLASRNLTIHSTAMTVLTLLSQHMDAVHLIPTVANSSQFGNSRVQPIMTRILASLTGPAYTQKPQLVNRLVLPVIWHHVSSKTPVAGETKATVQELCRVLLGCMGGAFLESATHLSVEEYKKLESLLERCRDGENR